MKPILLGIVTVGVVIGGMLLIPQTSEYVKEVVEVEKVVEVDSLEVRIAEAQELALASTTAKAQEAYNSVFDSEMKRISDEVKEDYIAEIEETITNPSY